MTDMEHVMGLAHIHYVCIMYEDLGAKNEEDYVLCIVYAICMVSMHGQWIFYP